MSTRPRPRPSSRTGSRRRGAWPRGAWPRGRGYRQRFPRLARWIDRWAPELGRPSIQREVRGLTLHLDRQAEEIAAVPYGSGAYEPEETAVVEALVTPDSVFVDIGANIGYYACIAARATGPGGQVFAFEPDPQNVRLLRRSVRANLFRQVRVEPAAVGDSTGTLDLFRSDINPTDHRAYDAGDRRSSVRVRSFALDDYFHPGQRIDVVKLDIQGFEMKALTGMRRILWNQREHIVLLTEFTPAALHECGSGPEELLGLFDSFGLKTWLVDGTPAPAARAIAACAGEGYTNLIVASEYPARLARAGIGRERLRRTDLNPELG